MYRAVLALLLAFSCSVVAGCGSDSDCERSEAEKAALESELESLRSQNEGATERIATLQEELESVMREAGTSKLRNPSWEELKRFVQLDKTDTREYIKNQFDCEGFTITLRDNATSRGFRSGYVAIGFGENGAGHTLNAFQTTDRGLVFIDNTERDTIGYVKKGKPYGNISLSGVKKEYIDCGMPPDQFWKPVTYTRYGGNIFDYSYYEHYREREEFYSQSVSAYNAEVSEYNLAVNAYNRKAGEYSLSELESWGDKLEVWADNLDKLIDDLGNIRFEQLGEVKSVEFYWN
ncbi:MAG: hypothetical protein R6U89_07605 [Dehalococcoidia bacterium]